MDYNTMFGVFVIAVMALGLAITLMFKYRILDSYLGKHSARISEVEDSLALLQRRIDRGDSADDAEADAGNYCQAIADARAETDDDDDDNDDFFSYDGRTQVMLLRIWHAYKRGKTVSVDVVPDFDEDRSSIGLGFVNSAAHKLAMDQWEDAEFIVMSGFVILQHATVADAEQCSDTVEPVLLHPTQKFIRMMRHAFPLDVEPASKPEVKPQPSYGACIGACVGAAMGAGQGQDKPATDDQNKLVTLTLVSDEPCSGKTGSQAETETQTITQDLVAVPASAPDVASTESKIEESKS